MQSVTQEQERNGVPWGRAERMPIESPSDPVTLDPDECDAVIFDMDGVLTDTARVHADAWKQMFDEYLRRSCGEDFEPFDIESDYRRHVDGKPRDEGVRSFLASRGIDLPEGEPQDPPDRETVCGLGNRKNELFLERLRQRGAERFEDALDLVRRLRSAGVRVAVFSASRNARHVLEEAGIHDLFQVRVDGVVAAEAGLQGKPAPDVLLEAARRLGVEPRRCAIVEDAQAGIEAGRKGGFGRVIGVARKREGKLLEAAGAHEVLRDLSQVRIGRRHGGHGIDRLPSALDHLGSVVERIGAREPIFLLDFDGTLAPIVEHRNEARLPAQTREVIAELASRRLVAIVSGRDLDDLRERVGLEEVYYAGSHGFRMAEPGGRLQEHEEARRYLPALAKAEEALVRELGAIEGVDVERKRYAVAVHYRRAPERAEEVRRAVARVQRACEGLRIAGGRKIEELRPALAWDKGSAVRWLIRAMGCDASRVFPIYVGDDLTDEDAFRAVEAHGLAIVVRGREGHTRARYALGDPDAVREFLARLDAELDGS